jgi:hypothetical protein
MPESGLVFGVVLAWFASHNFMFEAGIQDAFKIVNAKIQA